MVEDDIEPGHMPKSDIIKTDNKQLQFNMQSGIQRPPSNKLKQKNNGLFTLNQNLLMENLGES